MNPYTTPGHFTPHVHVKIAFIAPVLQGLGTAFGPGMAVNGIREGGRYFFTDQNDHRTQKALNDGATLGKKLALPGAALGTVYGAATGGFGGALAGFGAGLGAGNALGNIAGAAHSYGQQGRRR